MSSTNEIGSSGLFSPLSASDDHPGIIIRAELKAAGFSVSSAAVALVANRANLNNMLLGKTALTHDMAYRLNVLIRPDDENFDFARHILEMQAASVWKKTAAMRRLARVTVGVGRKYGEMHEAGTDGHLTLTAAGLQQKLADEAGGKKFGNVI